MNTYTPLTHAQEEAVERLALHHGGVHVHKLSTCIEATVPSRQSFRIGTNGVTIPSGVNGSVRWGDTR